VDRTLEWSEVSFWRLYEDKISHCVCEGSSVGYCQPVTILRIFSKGTVCLQFCKLCCENLNLPKAVAAAAAAAAAATTTTTTTTTTGVG